MASFKEAFAAARKAKGPGATFEWNGKRYSTNLKDEGKPSAGAQVARDAMVALGRAPAPKATPSKGSSERARPMEAPEKIASSKTGGAQRPKPRPQSGAAQSGTSGKAPRSAQAGNLDKPGRSSTPKSAGQKNPAVRTSQQAKAAAALKPPAKPTRRTRGAGSK